MLLIVEPCSTVKQLQQPDGEARKWNSFTHYCFDRSLLAEHLITHLSVTQSVDLFLFHSDSGDQLLDLWERNVALLTLAAQQSWVFFIVF